MGVVRHVFSSVAIVAAAVVFSSSSIAAQSAPPVRDLVFLIDGSGSIDSNDFAVQKDGISTVLADPSFIPLDGSVSVSLIQWSNSARVELVRTVLSSLTERDDAIATIGAVTQLGGGTSPHLGINAFDLVLSDLSTGNQTLCLSTDGAPSSQSALLSAAQNANSAGVERLTVLAIEDPGAFISADAEVLYGPAVFGGGSVVNARNAAEFAQVVGGACLGSSAELVGLEVNQHIQTWSNTVRLVDGKPTIVRAHVQSIDGTPTLTVGRLFGSRSGVSLPGSPLAPINSSVDAQLDATAVRDDINASLNFSLPATWTSGSVDLRVELLGGGTVCSEAAPPANTCEAAVSFESVDTPVVRLVRVPYLDTSGSERIVAVSDLDEQAERLKTVLPIADLDYELRILNRDNPFEEATDSDDNRGFLSDVNESLLTARSNDGSKSLYLGVLEGSITNGGGGLAAGIGSNASSWFVAGTEAREDYGYARNRGPHEFAHNVGEKHAGADDEITLCSGSSTNKGVEHPFRATIGGDEVPLLSPLGDADTEGWGVDPRFVIDGTNDDLAVIDPNTTFALMGYCNSTDNTSQGRWIDTDYQPRLIDAINDVDWAEGPESDDGIWSFFRGIFDLETGDVEFKPVFSNSPGVVPTPMPAGDHRIDLLDASGNVLATESFDPIEFESDAEVPFGGDAASVGLFVVPFLDAPDFASMEFVDPDGNVLGAQAASPSAPTVAVLSPTAGEVVTGELIEVTWTSADDDGDDLSHTVQYSADGGTTWTTLVIDTANTFTSIPRGAVAGSDSALVRVIASDGTRSTFDESEFFLVANNEPSVQISSPLDGSAFTGVQSVLLRGIASDVEDGPLSDSIAWSSDLDGSLGTGRELALIASDLSEGDHTITAAVSDENGSTSSATARVRIARVDLPPDIVDIEISLEGVAFEGEPVDVSALLETVNGPYEVVVDWGDGTSCPGVGTCEVTDAGNGVSVLGARHIYDTAGLYTVTVSITGSGGTIYTGSAQTIECDVSGTNEDDNIFGTSADEVICAFGGDDLIFGRGGNDTIFGGTGRDSIWTSAGDDIAFAGDGDDKIFGSKGEELLSGGRGDDSIFGRGDDDRIVGGPGNDRLFGGSGNDRIDGGGGNDQMYGARGDDQISGGSGDDALFGNAGADALDGGEGTDSCRQGSGTGSEVGCE